MKKGISQNAIQTPDGTILLSLDNKVASHKDANGEIYHVSGGIDGFTFKSKNKVKAEDLSLNSKSLFRDFVNKSLILLGNENKVVRISSLPDESLKSFIMQNINTDKENIYLAVNVASVVLGERQLKSLKVKNDLKEVVTSTPAYLFTTEDGVKMFEGDVWWSVVLDGVRIPKETKTMDYKGSNPSKNVVTFSSKGLAYKAALEGMDRAQVLTLNDISMNIGQLDRLENIAKNRFLNRHPVKEKASDKKYSKEDITNMLKSTGIFANLVYPEQFVDKFFK